MRLSEEVTHAHDDAIEGWGRALDLKDHETEGHSQRVTEIAIAMARHWGMSPKEVVEVRRGSLLHDIGKMGVPDEILKKPGSLTEDEWTIMRSHTGYAREMLGGLGYLGDALSIPVHHHERWDGTGYPDGLSGEDIPRPARIFAVADVWDALSNDRPYRRAWPSERVLHHIKEGSGSHFDPAAVQTFLEVLEARDVEISEPESGST
jgi:putative nucleotidyltransferase with HDIG domain